MGKQYNQLSVDERCEIFRLHAGGASLRGIGRQLGRSAATVSREIRRNSGVAVGYKVSWATIQANARRCRKLFKMHRSSALRDTVLERLAMGQSPEQIVGRLGLEHGKPLIGVESIYRYIYWRVNSHKDYLHRLLPRAKFQRGFRGRAGGSPALKIKGRVSIADRPAEILLRKDAGHWEADLMAFSRYGQHLLVAVERTTRFLRAAILPGKKAEPLARILKRWLKDYPPGVRKSLTVDNGTEFAGHLRLKPLIVLGTFFCSPWQKGSVENAIGRLRRRLPRRTDLAALNRSEIDAIVLACNTTPRKCLRFLTPAETLLTLIKTEPVALET